LFVIQKTLVYLHPIINQFFLYEIKNNNVLTDTKEDIYK